MMSFRLIIKSVLLLTFLTFSSLHAQLDDENLEANLATESSLIPLYLMPFTQESSEFSETYLKQLEKVLVFDLSHNGSTTVVKQEDKLNHWENGSLKNIAQWQSQNIAYVVKGTVNQRSLDLTLLDVSKRAIKTTEPLVLTGQLNEDRRLIHRLADAIHKNFLGTEGIASTHILYTLRNQIGKDSTQWVSEVWEADYDGANPRQLTHERSYCVMPIYLPPKSGFTTGGFLYVSYQMGQPKIYISSLKEGVGRRLLYLRGNQLMPALASKRDKVAFISDITGNPDLFLQPFNPETGIIGKPQQIFSARQATQGSPTFSPNGNQIAFVSNKDGSPKIYVIGVPRPGTSLKEIKATLITKRNRENSAPAWSPDGTKLAYCARSTTDRQIWIYDFNTKQEKQLTKGAGHKENPSWAPNSLSLVYNTSNQDTSELFLINLLQEESVQISSGRGEKRFPNWEPRVH
jgi:TolB protein